MKTQGLVRWLRIKVLLPSLSLTSGVHNVKEETNPQSHPRTHRINKLVLKQKLNKNPKQAEVII